VRDGDENVRLNTQVSKQKIAKKAGEGMAVCAEAETNPQMIRLAATRRLLEGGF